MYPDGIGDKIPEQYINQGYSVFLFLEVPLKRGLRWKLPANLDELRGYVTARLNEMTEEVIASITGRQSILDALSVAGL